MSKFFTTITPGKFIPYTMVFDSVITLFEKIYMTWVEQ